MKRIFLSFAIAVIAAVSAFAAKSDGKVHVFAQPDGTTLMVQLLGDENFAWYQTSDGVLLTRIGNAYYVAKTAGDGTLSSTGILAHNIGTRDEKEMQAIQVQDKSLFFSSANETLEAKAMRKVIIDYPSGHFCPHTGTVRVPVILMNYTDLAFVTDNDTWAEYFNGTESVPYTKETKYQGYSSVTNYFGAASNGQLDFIFDIYGPYTSDYGHDTYGHNKSGEYSLVSEAIKKVDDDINFNDYDSNGDGFVDLVYIVYAGTGANISGDNTDFWPKCWYNQSISTKEGLKINTIGGANELAKKATAADPTWIRAGIGVTCHEMSHGLGLPDLYWTLTTEPKDAQGYTDYNNCGPEDWDLMDGGENLYNGIWPCQYAAWEREILGWLPTEELTEATDVTLFPLNKEGGKACRVTNPANAYEYYIIENYQNDEWNYYVNNRYGSGLMITHVNATSNGLDMKPNNTYGKPNVTILPADGFILASYSAGKTMQYKGDVVTMPDKNDVDSTGVKIWTNKYFIPDMKGDPYVGSKSDEQVTQVAAYKNYTGEDMVAQYPITDITRNDDGSISFKFMGGTPTPDGIADITKDADKKSTFNLQGQKVGNGYRGIVIRGGKKYICK